MLFGSEAVLAPRSLSSRLIQSLDVLPPLCLVYAHDSPITASQPRIARYTTRDSLCDQAVHLALDIGGLRPDSARTRVSFDLVA